MNPYDQSEILTSRKYAGIIRELKSKNPEITKVLRLLILGGEDLSQGNLKTHQRMLWEQFKDNYNGTIVIVKTNFGKEFAFFIPEQFKE